MKIMKDRRNVITEDKIRGRSEREKEIRLLKKEGMRKKSEGRSRWSQCPASHPEQKLARPFLLTVCSTVV